MSGDSPFGFLANHQPEQGKRADDRWCAHCGHLWPCPVVRAFRAGLQVGQGTPFGAVTGLDGAVMQRLTGSTEDTR